MASRCRSLSQPAFSLMKSSLTKPCLRPNPSPSVFDTASSFTFQRSISQLAMIQSLLPLHSAVSSARLTSCLGIDSRGSRSLSQELGLSVPR